MEVSLPKLFVALLLVFILGVLFAVVNGVYTTEEGSPLPLITYAISFVSLLAGAFLVILFQWKINQIQLERSLCILPQEERLIVKLLLQHKDSIEQNKLVALSGFTKVKVSRLVKILEQRGVVKKTDLGNTNLIVLTL